LTLQEGIGWTICLLLVGLISAFVAIPSRRVRSVLFYAIGGTGLAVGWYGFIVAYYGEQQQIVRVFEWFGQGEARGAPPVLHGYFGHLGLPLSLVIGASLAFAILALETTFTRKHLKRYVYRSLAASFVIWIVSVVAVEASFNLRSYVIQTDSYRVVTSSQFHLPSLLGNRGAHLLLFAGFLIGAWRSFPKNVFRIFFPLAAMLTGLSLLLEHWRSPTKPLEAIFETNVWLLFWLVAYFYLNVHHHGEQTKSEKIKLIPKVALFLVGVGVLHEFPQYQALRKLFPTATLIAERAVIMFDLALIIALVAMTSSGRIFNRDSASMQPVIDRDQQEQT
jgi:hypothetical protein